MIFRAYKITPEILDRMKKSREEGKTYMAIAVENGVTTSTVQYHLNENCKKKTLKRARESYKHNQNKKKRIRTDYNKNYLNDRYSHDAKFRKMIQDMNRENQRKVREKRYSKGLCVKCGGKKRKFV